jgi:hypothetical protein
VRSRNRPAACRGRRKSRTVCRYPSSNGAKPSTAMPSAASERWMSADDLAHNASGVMPRLCAVATTYVWLSSVPVV